MTLEKLFALIPEGCAIEVEDEGGNILANYDGRDAIPESLNGCLVVCLHPIDGFTIAVEVA